MEHYMVLGFLGINSWTDIRRREISLCSVGIFMALGILYECLYLRKLPTVLPGLLPGMVMAGISKVTKEALGMGDALLMMPLGIFMGLEATFNVLFTALLLAALWAGGLFLIKKRKREYEFPFVPFLLLGYLLYSFP